MQLPDVCDLEFPKLWDLLYYYAQSALFELFVGELGQN